MGYTVRKGGGEGLRCTSSDLAVLRPRRVGARACCFCSERRRVETRRVHHLVNQRMTVRAAQNQAVESALRDGGKESEERARPLTF
jgi:enhancing lycopene biosynthesis protein 2